jgi:hypothetical protein
MRRRLTNIGEIGNDASSGQRLEVPLWRTLGLPCPEDPSIGLLVANHLGLDEVADVLLGLGAQATYSANGVAVAGADVRGVFEGAVVTCASAAAVQPTKMSVP